MEILLKINKKNPVYSYSTNYFKLQNYVNSYMVINKTADANQLPLQLLLLRNESHQVKVFTANVSGRGG